MIAPARWRLRLRFSRSFISSFDVGVLYPAFSICLSPCAELRSNFEADSRLPTSTGRKPIHSALGADLRTVTRILTQLGFMSHRTPQDAWGKTPAILPRKLSVVESALPRVATNITQGLPVRRESRPFIIASRRSCRSVMYVDQAVRGTHLMLKDHNGLRGRTALNAGDFIGVANLRLCKVSGGESKPKTYLLIQPLIVESVNGGVCTPPSNPSSRDHP